MCHTLKCVNAFGHCYIISSLLYPPPTAHTHTHPTVNVKTENPNHRSLFIFFYSFELRWCFDKVPYDEVSFPSKELQEDKCLAHVFITLNLLSTLFLELISFEPNPFVVAALAFGPRMSLRVTLLTVHVLM